MITADYEQIKEGKVCPLCSSSKVSSVLSQSSWRIEKCLVCHNAWTLPAPQMISYDDKDFHSQFNYSDVSALPKQWRKSVLMQVKLLAGYLTPKAKILEIGCGVGISLKEFSKLGFKVCGIEPSITASQRGRESGMNIITGYFPDVDLSETFDAVILAHVLEHIPVPYNFLKKVAEVAPGGNILIVQSNWKGLMPRIQKELWHAWVPEHHFWHFASKGLVKILNCLGWKVMKIEYSSLSHGNKIFSRIGSIIPRMGDQMHVIASIPGETSG